MKQINLVKKKKKEYGLWAPGMEGWTGHTFWDGEWRSSRVIKHCLGYTEARHGGAHLICNLSTTETEAGL